MSASQAGRSYTHGTYSTNSYGSRGYAGSSYGTYSGYTYDPAAAAQAQAAANAQTAQSFQNLNAAANAAVSDLSRTILKKETVTPNEWHGGYIRLQQPAELSNTISLMVTFGGEEHSFQFTQNVVQ